MIHIAIKDTIKDYSRHLTWLEKKQLPFATALAQTRTAQAAQTAIQNHIKKVFSNRVTWWKKQQPTGVKIKMTHKSHVKGGASGVIWVYTDAYFARLQEEGGTKTPHTGGLIAVPTSAVPKARRKSGGAATMEKQKTVFYNRHTKRIYRRVGGKKSRRVKRLFNLVPTAQVKPRMDFEATGLREARRVFPEKFREALARALRTAR